jgi:hypothetical protein
VIAFLSTRLGQAVALIVAGLLACGGSYLYGRHDQARLDNVAALEAKLAAAKADIEISNALAGIAEDERRAAERAVAANQDRIDDYEKALALRPNPRCSLDADDVRRLRALNPAP